MIRSKPVFISGWVILFIMIVIKAIFVFDGEEFIWDPMFLGIPYSLIIIGALPEFKKHEKVLDEDKEIS